MNKFYPKILMLITCFIASLSTVVGQFDYIYTYFGRDYIMTRDFRAHHSIINSEADEPYRFRVLSNLALQTIFDLVHSDPPPKWTEPYRSMYEKTALGFRVAQNFLIFLLAFKYFETLGFSLPTRFIGVILLSLCMGFAFYQSNLSFYTYTEIAFFLLAGIIINIGKDWWILPITIVATLNREGAIFIPVMLFFARLSEFDWSTNFITKVSSYKWLLLPILSTASFIFVFMYLRYYIGSSNYSESRYGEVYPGIELFYQNILNRKTWIGIIQMYGAFLITLTLLKSWPKILRWYLLFFAIPWFLAVFIFGSADETRLFLTPLVVVFIPAALQLIEKYK